MPSLWSFKTFRLKFGRIKIKKKLIIESSYLITISSMPLKKSNKLLIIKLLSYYETKILVLFYDVNKIIIDKKLLLLKW